MKYKPLDMSGVKTYPLAERANKVVMARDAAAGVRSGMTVEELLRSLPAQLASRDLLAVIDAVAAARAAGKPVVMALGGHVIKCGLQPVL